MRPDDNHADYSPRSVGNRLAFDTRRRTPKTEENTFPRLKKSERVSDAFARRSLRTSGNRGDLHHNIGIAAIVTLSVKV